MTHTRWTYAALMLSAAALPLVAGCATTSSASGGLTADYTESAATTTTLSLPRDLPTTTVARATTTTSSSTTVLPTFEQEPVVVSAMAEPLSAVGREDGEETARLQERLLELGFWVQSTDGIFGLTTRQAVMAAQKYFGLPATSSVDEATAEALSTATTRPQARSDRGTLVEIDKSLQLGFFVIDGVTEWVLNVSTGSEIPYSEPNQNDPAKVEEGDSITDPGLFKVDRERAEGWWDGDLGSIYRPKYFNGGIAVHGSGSIPNYPASHGCVRVSTPAMDWIWEEELMPMGTPVWVHGSIPR
jgi:peptidoglycan hydrolase-like protein with peptidoglycan-binding domain